MSVVVATEMAQDYPRMREELRLIFETWCTGVEKLIRAAQERGEVDPRHDAAQLARFLVNAWEGTALRLKIDRDRAAVDDFMNTAFKVLLK